jgi:DNA-binding helix-hairpin-helix protein with protein kinase domain
MMRNEEEQSQGFQREIEEVMQRTQRVDSKIRRRKEKLRSIEAKIVGLKELEKTDVVNVTQMHLRQKNKNSEEGGWRSLHSTEPVCLLMRESDAPRSK